MRNVARPSKKEADRGFLQPWISTPTGRMRMDDATGSELAAIDRPELTPSNANRYLACEIAVKLAAISAFSARSIVQVIAEESVLIERWSCKAGPERTLVRSDGVVSGTATAGTCISKHCSRQSRAAPRSAIRSYRRRM